MTGVQTCALPISSTLHQCFKYLQSGIKKVNADLKPFAETEALFVDAKFYVEDDIPNEVLLVEIPSMESKQGEKEHVRLVTRKDIIALKKGPECGNDHSSESTGNSMRVKISTPSNNPSITPLCTIITSQERTITICRMPSIHSKHGKASCKAHNRGCSQIL